LVTTATTGLKGAYSIANIAYGLGVTAGMGAVKSFLNSVWLSKPKFEEEHNLMPEIITEFIIKYYENDN
jgi:hypothetical protein